MEFSLINRAIGVLIGHGLPPETARGELHRRANRIGHTLSAASLKSAKEIKELMRKNAELEQTIEILIAATFFFVRECDPPRR